jgi:hypothetical protein
MHTTHFWYNLHQVRSKPNNLNVLLSKETKGPKQDSQNQPRSPMPEGGEP